MSRVGLALARALLRISRRVDQSRFRSIALTAIHEGIASRAVPPQHREIVSRLLAADIGVGEPALACAWREGFEADRHLQGEEAELALDAGFTAMHRGFELRAALEMAEALTPSVDLPLDTGSMLIGQFGGDQQDAATVNSTLDAISDAVRESMDASRLPDQAWMPTPANRLLIEEEPERAHPALLTLYHLNEVLYQQWGFKGNTADYYNPLNSFLGTVLQQRRGIPISMAALYSGVLRRLGVESHGTRFPGHFLLRVSGSQQLVFSQTLLGDWTARYGPNGPEVVRIIEGSKGGLEAIKLTGDANVPAGQLSWRCPEIQVGSKVEGELQLADTGYRNPVFEAVQVFAESSECIIVKHDKGIEPLIFERIDPSEPLFVDSFNSGVIMSKDQCLVSLKQQAKSKSGESAQVEKFVEAVGSPEVFARMSRNLVTCYSQKEEGGGLELTKQWHVITSCLAADIALKTALGSAFEFEDGSKPIDSPERQLVGDAKSKRR